MAKFPEHSEVSQHHSIRQTGVLFEALRDHHRQTGSLLVGVGSDRNIEFGSRLIALSVLPLVRQARTEVFGSTDAPFHSHRETVTWLRGQAADPWALTFKLDEFRKRTQQTREELDCPPFTASLHPLKFFSEDSSRTEEIQVVSEHIRTSAGRG